MTSYWSIVAKLYNQYCPKHNSITITFDNKVKKCESNVLDDNIRTHGGGLTDIPQAFLFMEKILMEYDVGQKATILFISDGQDNHINTLEDRLAQLKGNLGRQVTFLCIGILKNFPTFLSM